jgi:hypothetical protein
MTSGTTLSADFCDAIVLWPNCVSVGSQHAPNDAHSLRRVYRVIWHSTLAAGTSSGAHCGAVMPNDVTVADV